MNFKKIKRYLTDLKADFYIVRQAFKRRVGFKYLYYRYIVAPRILKRKIPIERSRTSDAVSTCLLLSRRDFIMGLWSLASFYLHATEHGQLIIQSDGSITEKQERLIYKLFPSAKMMQPEEAEQRIAATDMPDGVRTYRMETPVVFLKKLIDTSVVSDTPYVFIIDSDLIWLKDPVEISEAIRKQENISYMMAKDRPSYVPFKNNESLDESLSIYNGGVIFFKKENFNLKKLDEFFGRLDMTKTQRLIGQSGHAYSLANLHPLDIERYYVRGTQSNDPVVLHYTSPKRELFYTEGLPKVVDKILI